MLIMFSMIYTLNLHLSSLTEFWSPNGLERLTSHQKVAGSIPVWGSEIVFLRIELDDRSTIIQKWETE